MNVQDVVTRVKRIFGDEAGVQVTDEDIIRWINDAQEQIAVDNEGLVETKAVTDVIKGTAEYDLPADLSVLRSLKFKARRVNYMSFAEFTEYLDGHSEESSGTPEAFMVWNNKITLYPVPSEDATGALVIYYVKHPPPVANLADPLFVPVQYHNAVVKFCLKEAYELDEDFQKSQTKKNEFDHEVMKLNDRNKWGSQEYYPRITVLPEDEWHG